MKKLAFKVRLDGMEGSSVAALSAPFSVEKVFGTKARVPVRGTINGFPFRSSLSAMAGRHRMAALHDLANLLEFSDSFVEQTHLPESNT